MIPRTLKAAGFLGFSEDIALDFQTLSAACITGPNGAGKSTLICDSLLFALYGKARTRGVDCLSDEKETGYVELCFEHREQEYTVRRSMKRNKGQNLTLYQGTLDLTERLLTNCQDKLQEILGFSDTLLLTTSLATQGQMAFFVGLSPAERAKVLIEILGLALWEGKRQTAQHWLTTHKDVAARMAAIEAEQADLRAQCASDTTRLTRLDCQQLLLGQQHRERQDTLAALSHTVAAHQGAYHEVAARQSTVRARRKTLEYELIATPEPGALDRQLDDIEAQLANAHMEGQQAREKANACRDLAGEYRRLVHIGQGLGKLQTDLLDTVPCQGQDALFFTCPLLINAHAIRTQQTEFLAATFPGATKTFTSYLVELEEDAAGYEQDLHDWVLQERELELKARELQGERCQVLHLRTEAAKKAGMQEEYDRLIGEEQELQAKMASLSALAADEAELADLQREVQRIAREENAVKDQLYQLRAQCTLAEGRLTVLSQEWDNAHALATQASYYKTLAQAYQDIPSLLFNETIPWLETRANEVLAVIAPGRTLEIQVFRDTKAGTQQRTLDLLCHGPEGSLLFDLLSGSEQFRLALALRLALARILADAYDTPLEFFVMDEGLGCLDSANCAIIKQTLRTVAPVFRLFLVITHVEELKDLFPTELAVSKTPPYVSRLTHAVGAV